MSCFQFEIYLTGRGMGTTSRSTPTSKNGEVLSTNTGPDSNLRRRTFRPDSNAKSEEPKSWPVLSSGSPESITNIIPWKIGKIPRWVTDFINRGQRGILAACE
jgi:hypothetical protein